MNTTQLECFAQVAANLNFRRAAQELHLSQPTVSKQVSALEDEVGGALFVRSTRSVALTALGESFLQDAEEILRLMYASSEKARKMAAGNTLLVGYSDTTELTRLAPVLRKLRRAEKGLAVGLRQAPRDVNVDQLARRRVDAVMGFRSPALETGDVTFELLREDALVCVVRKGSRLARLDAVGMEDVTGLSQVVCLPLGLQRRGYAAQDAIPKSDETITTHCQTTAEALCLVDAGFGYALLPSVQALNSPQHVCVPWAGAPQAAYGVYLRASDESEQVQHFLETAREAYAA